MFLIAGMILILLGMVGYELLTQNRRKWGENY